MINVFKPSEFFHMHMQAVKEILMFQDTYFSGIFFWIILPVLPATILGWYIADVTLNIIG